MREKLATTLLAVIVFIGAVVLGLQKVSDRYWRSLEAISITFLFFVLAASKFADIAVSEPNRALYDRLAIIAVVAAFVAMIGIVKFLRTENIQVPAKVH